MVNVNFRIGYEITKDRIINFFKDFGYTHRGLNKTAIKIEDEYIPTDEFIRNTNSGRFHLFIALGQKYSGKEKYPQVKIFLHYDIVKNVNSKVRHFPDSKESRNMKEIFRIEKKLVMENIGFLEEKDRNCAHTTLEYSYKPELLKTLKKDYKRYDKGKYRKRFNSSQCVISIIEQEPYIHIICVYATIINREHILNKKKSEKELERIFSLINM